MAKVSLSELAAKERNLDVLPAGLAVGGLLGILTELQGLSFTVVNGTTSATNIAVAGIATEDTIIFVLRFPAAYAIANISDLTSEASITSAGNIQLSTTNTTGERLVVFWLNKR